MQSQFPPPMLDQLQHAGIIAVLVVDQLEHGIPLARALLAGGVEMMELTLRTPVAVDALRSIREEVPEMTAGIGTILTPEQAREVASAGAAFGVAPGTNPRVIEAAQEAGLPFAPGVTTASDVERALELGCRELKFFPAEPSGGLKYLKSLAAPYAHLGVRFMPLGGLNLDNMEVYVQDPVVLAIGGSWLAPRPMIQQEDWSGITANAVRATEIIKRVREGVES